MPSDAAPVPPTPLRQYAGGRPVPQPYELWADGLYVGAAPCPPGVRPTLGSPPPPERRAQLDLVARLPLWVERVGTALDTGEELVELGWLPAPGAEPARLWVGRLELADRSRLVGLAGRGLPVRTGNAARLEEYLDRCLGQAGSRERCLVAARSGAYEVDGRWGWLVGEQWIGPQEGAVQLDPRSTSSWSAGLRVGLGGCRDREAALARWLEVRRRVLSLGPVVRWLHGTSFAAPLLRFVRHRTFVVHHWGPSGRGKTALLRFDTSVWGDPQVLVASHNRTALSMAEVFTHLTDLPVAFDELQAAPEGAKGDVSLIYALCQEHGRGRAARSGGLRAEVTSWHSIVRMTGEEPLVGRDRLNLGGQAARSIEICAPLLSPEQAKALNAEISRMPFGVAGPAFLRWLGELVNDPGGPRLLEETYRAFHEALCGPSPGGRTLDPVRAANLATGALGALLADVALEGADPVEAAARALEDARAAGEVASREEQEAYLTVTQRAVQAIVDHRLSHRERWLDLADEADAALLSSMRFKHLTGVLAGEEVWLVQNEAVKLLAQAGLPVARALSDLAREGVLLCEPGCEGRAAKRQLGRFRNRVYVLDREAAGL